MIKKLFLFTLLVSSFLVISCSNKDTTAPTVTGIDSSYIGTYTGKIKYNVPSSPEYQTTLVVKDDGSASFTVDTIISTVDILKADIKKTGEGKYTAEGIDFSFAESSVTINITFPDDTPSMSGTISKQQQQ